MTDTELGDRARSICQRLSQAVVEVVPEGIGHWAGAWEIVAAADAEFMLALAKWEATPGDESAAGVKAAYEAVLNAWRRAATEYDLRTPPTQTFAEEEK